MAVMMFRRWMMMDCWGFANDSVEAIVFVSGVVNSSDGTIRFD